MSTTPSIELMWQCSQYEKSKDAGSSTATHYYLVRNVASEEAAVAALEAALRGNAATISAWQGIPFRSVSVEERFNEDTWKLAAKYQQASSDSSGGSEDPEPQFAFDVTGGSRHIVMPIANIHAYPSGASHYGINDGDGIDITYPVCTIAETRFFSPSVITDSWRREASLMVGKVNSATFRGYSAGELLFTGCNGSRTGERSDDLWQITFKFAVQQNETNLSFHNYTYNKRGWDLAWCRYKEQVQTVGGNKVVVRVPVALFVDQVYPYTNFNNLSGL